MELGNPEHRGCQDASQRADNHQQPLQRPPGRTREHLDVRGGAHQQLERGQAGAAQAVPAASGIDAG